MKAEPADARLAQRCALFKDRCATLVELARWLAMFDAPVSPSADERAAHLTEAVRPALRSLRERLRHAPWDKAGIAQALKDTLAEHKLKMPQLAPPARVAVCGRVQTPAIDAVLALFDREVVLEPPGRSGTLERYIIPRSSRSTLPCGRVGSKSGGIAQLGERLHGMQEVSGSIPLTSTTPQARIESEQERVRPLRLEA